MAKKVLRFRKMAIEKCTLVIVLIYLEMMMIDKLQLLWFLEMVVKLVFREQKFRWRCHVEVNLLVFYCKINIL